MNTFRNKQFKNQLDPRYAFYDFMNFVLNDPINGYYGSGKAALGVRGDFVTSPSLSDDFAFWLVNK